MLEDRGSPVRLPREWAESLLVRARYGGYIERQRRLAGRAEALERLILPEELWQDPLGGLSHEAREKLRRWKPATAGQASRIAGVSPADVAVLMIHARKAASKHTAQA